MHPVFATTPEALAEPLQRAGIAPYRAGQVLSWIYGRGVVDPEAMTNLPRELRALLAGELAPPALDAVNVARSVDGTRKFAFRLADGELIESVLIPDRHRMTLCVSSQVGCAMGCGFCATARLGLRRHLTPDEIVAQVMFARRHLEEEPLGCGHLTNIVFMGMGEPLHNLENLIAALGILTAPWGLSISPRRITVSTVGLVPQMRELLERTQANLAVSLSATTEEGRRELMPVTRKYSLQELMDACRELPVPRRRRITFEYVMLAGVNDSRDDARRLVRLLHGIRGKVNLLPLNEAPGIPFRRPDEARVDAFARVLAEHGVRVSVRKSRGRDIRAACGQLIVEGGRKSPGQRLADQLHSSRA